MERLLPPTLSSKQRHRLLGDAMKQSADGVDRSSILTGLVDGGFSRADAPAALTAIEQQLAGKRSAFRSSRSLALVIASVQLLAAIIMLLTGFYTQRVGSLLLGAGLAIVGYRRLRQIVGHAFGDVVLVNRPSAAVSG